MSLRKRRFTWLDGLCVVLVLAIAAGAVWYFTHRNSIMPSAAKSYEITMRFTQATTDPYDFYQVGDTMYFQNRTDVLGTITALRAMDREVEDYNEETDQYVVIIDPRWKTIEMKVLVQGTLQGGTFTVAGEKLHIGKTLYPQSDTTRSIMVIWDIKEVAA